MLACPERIASPDKALEVKQIKEALARRECEEFEMALQHKLKLDVYRELKQEVSFEGYRISLIIRYP